MALVNVSAAPSPAAACILPGGVVQVVLELQRVCLPGLAMHLQAVLADRFGQGREQWPRQLSRTAPRKKSGRRTLDTTHSSLFPCFELRAGVRLVAARASNSCHR